MSQSFHDWNLGKSEANNSDHLGFVIVDNRVNYVYIALFYDRVLLHDVFSKGSNSHQ